MVVDVALDVNQWAQQQFGNCRFGDERLVKRAVKVAAQVAASLDRPCARRLRDLAVGTEECSRRGSNKRMKQQHDKKRCDAPLTRKAPYKPYAGKPHVRIWAGGVP